MNLVIPKTHHICQITKIEGDDMTMEEYRNHIYELLENIDYKQFYKHTLREKINHRYPLSTGYFIKDIIKDKVVCQVGSRFGDINYEISKHCKKMYNIEMLKHCDRCARNLYKNDSKQEFIFGDVFKIDVPKADVYYLWCGYLLDYEILEFLLKNGHKGTFLLGVPQDEPKLKIFLEKLTTYDYDYECVMIPFKEKDIQVESKEIPPLAEITSPNWSSWQTFDNLCGVMYLMKLTIQ